MNDRHGRFIPPYEPRPLPRLTCTALTRSGQPCGSVAGLDRLCPRHRKEGKA